MKAVIEHPSSSKVKQAAVERLHRLREEHRIAAERMWGGALAGNFTAPELAVLDGYGLLCPRDKQLLTAIRRGRPPEWSRAASEPER